MPSGFRVILRRTFESIRRDEVLNHAAQVAFFFTFALFPLLLFLTSLFGLILHEDSSVRTQLLGYLAKVMPASAFGLVETWIDEVAQGSSGGKLTFGLVVALWSASSGLDNLRVSLNAVYGIKETRSWLHTRALSVVLTVSLGFLVASTLMLVFYGTEVLNWLLPGLPAELTGAVSYSVVLLALLFAFAVVFNLVPDHPTRTWAWFSPGAFTGIFLWLSFSAGFRIYLGFFDTYARTYGSLGAVIILLLWLYLTAVVVLVGAVINRVVIDLRAENP